MIVRGAGRVLIYYNTSISDLSKPCIAYTLAFACIPVGIIRAIRLYSLALLGSLIKNLIRRTLGLAFTCGSH